MDDADQYLAIPELTMTSLELYRDEHLPTGGFLQAVLSNDLAEAVNMADKDNSKALTLIVKWAYNHLPGSSWGSPSEYQDWIKWKDGGIFSP